MQLEEAIELAEAKAGGLRALARALDVDPSNLCKWKARKKACPWKTQAAIADVAGIDFRELAWEEVQRAVGKASRGLATGALVTFAALLGSGLARPAYAAGTSDNV